MKKLILSLSMKRIICFMAIIFCFAGITEAQTFDYTDIKKNGVYLEVFFFNHDEYPGRGYVSINYERVFGKKKRLLLGLGVYPDFGSDKAFIALPITISGLTSPLSNHHLEYGLGIAPTLYYNSDNFKKLSSDVPFLVFPIMYRYQKNEGLIIRGGVNILGVPYLIGGWKILYHPSISIGYKF